MPGTSTDVTVTLTLKVVGRCNAKRDYVQGFFDAIAKQANAKAQAELEKQLEGELFQIERIDQEDGVTIYRDEVAEERRG